MKAGIAERLYFEQLGHEQELYGRAIARAEPGKLEGLIHKRYARREDTFWKSTREAQLPVSQSQRSQ